MRKQAYRAVGQHRIHYAEAGAEADVLCTTYVL